MLGLLMAASFGLVGLLAPLLDQIEARV
jgi:predicted outer membrane lipoprotein